MTERTIHPYCNDWQYSENTKDGKSMNQRTFAEFVKDLIREHALDDPLNKHCLYISLSDIPPNDQKEYLKQWMFSEGMIEDYEEACNNPWLIDAYLVEYKKSLEYWLDKYISDVEADRYQDYLDDNDLVVRHHSDNGEPYTVRRYT